jgi:hypothetical protein
MSVKNPVVTGLEGSHRSAIISLLRRSGVRLVGARSKLKSRGVMSGFSFRFATLLLATCTFTSVLCPIAVAQRGGVRKPPKKQLKKDPPAGPSYTPTPLDPLPLDQTPAVAPQVSYEGGELSIVAHNSTLADVLRAVVKLTGAEMEIPPNASERVVADLGPGPARDVLAELLNGTHFNYVMVGSTTDPSAVHSIVLTPRTATAETASAAPPSRPGISPRGTQQYQVPAAQAATGENASADDPEDAAEDDPAPEASQEAPPTQQDQNPPGHQTPKTPEQLLQELQQRQQQQQQPQQGQPPLGLVPNQPPTQAPNPQKPD